MGCSNDSEKPLNKINKKTKKSYKNSDDILVNNNNKNEDEKGNSNNNNSSYNSEKEEDEGEKSKNEEENFENINPLIPNFQPYLQSKNDPYFNFPEVKENKYVGKGLKKIERIYIKYIKR